jgi:signal transduction histidine kinase
MRRAFEIELQALQGGHCAADRPDMTAPKTTAPVGQNSFHSSTNGYEMPRWAQTKVPHDGMLTGSSRLVRYIPALAVCLTTSAGGVLLGAEDYIIAAWAMIGIAVISTCYLFVRIAEVERSVRADLHQSQLRFDEMFDRAGISIWREDWSAVGEEILRLKQSGVADVVNWFANHPEEALALHKRVTVSDVNNYSVELMRAPTKKALLGPLGNVLVGSEKSFGRWLAAIARGDSHYFGESLITRLDGEAFHCFVTAGLPKDLEGFRNITVSTIDITSYKRDQQKLALAEEEVARAQRIVTIGALTATVAHEINSPIAAVASNAAACLSWLRRDKPDIEEAVNAAQAALNEVERVRAVIDRTRSYLGRSARRDQPINLGTIVRTAFQLVEREAQLQSVELTLSVERRLPQLVGDPIQIQQVLVNLILNGIQAMADLSAGKALSVTVAREGASIRVDVADTGHGIEPDRLRKIFEPFHSTKDNGMGLGLSISRNSVNAHGGRLWVDRSDTAGTIFSFTIPSQQEN